ncbi:hypothetical protein ES703_21552 [subsurface metagenome]
MSSDFYQPLEPSCRLPSLAVFSWNAGGQPSHDLDVFAPQGRERRLPPVHDEHPHVFLNLKHLAQRLEHELLVAAIHPDGHRFRGLDPIKLDVRGVLTPGHVSTKYGHPVRRGAPVGVGVDAQELDDPLEGAYHVLSGRL